jgi:hypothetical protein
MPLSISELRDQLKASLEELALWLGISRQRVHQYEIGDSYEGGEIGEKLRLLSSLVGKAEQNRAGNPWVNHDTLHQEATEWKDKQRARAGTTADELTYQLNEMVAEYEDGIKALDRMAHMLNNPECPQSRMPSRNQAMDSDDSTAGHEKNPAERPHGAG